jgi:GR25 family glycosyltransferase involved in LPS biosynthesis
MIDILNILVIHSKNLTIRANKFKNVLHIIDDISKKRKFAVKTQFISQFEPSDIEKNILEYNKIVSYDPINDADFDNQRFMLSPPIISNIEKHKEAWRSISKLNDSNKQLYLIIEDDALLFPEYIDNLNEILNLDHSKWDMLLLGLSIPNPPNDSNDFINFRNHLKILPSKEAYLIKPSTARKLLDQTTKLKFTMRIHLSYLIKMNPDIKVLFPKKRVFIDGSKLGIVPSSIHPTNILIFNSEFVQMHMYIKKTADEIKADFDKIDKLYKIVDNIHSPDAMHIYGLLLLKVGRIKEAEKILNEAIIEMKKQQGYLNNQSEIIVNLVDLYKNLQTDIDTNIKDAKYSVHTLPSLLVEND